MLLETVKHSYACSVMQKNKAKIYRDGKRILNQLYPLQYPPLKTFIKIGRNYALPYLKSPIKKIIEYDSLKDYGWKITSISTSGESFFESQRLRYVLMPLHSSSPDYGGMPDNHHAEIDLINKKIRFIGKNVSSAGFTEWTPLKPEMEEREKSINPFQLDKIRSSARSYFESRLPESLHSKKEEIIKEIKEAVVGITENGEICCIKKTDESPIISISGQKGMGKTYTMNNLEGQFYRKFRWNIFNINDVKYDTQTRCMTWDKLKGEKFLKELSAFYEPSLPLPYIYLHPIIKGLSPEKVIYKDEVGFEISFPLKKFILDSNLIKYNKQWETTPKSKKYIRKLIEDDNGNERLDGLLHLSSLDEIQNLVNSEISEKMQTLRDSVSNLLKDVWSRNILDNTSGIKSSWKAEINGKTYEYPPWDICLLSGLCPSFITEYARTQDWFAIWVKHVLSDVFEFSENSDYKKIQGKNIILSGDELVQLLRTLETRGIIDQAIREGRTKYCGFMQAVQFFSDIPDSIIANIDIYITFNTQAKSDFSYLQKKFDLKKQEVSEIKKLNKFQCMAFGDFVLYDSEGNRYSNDEKPVKIIRVKPPNAQNFGGYKTLE